MVLCTERSCCHRSCSVSRAGSKNLEEAFERHLFFPVPFQMFVRQGRNCRSFADTGDDTDAGGPWHSPAAVNWSSESSCQTLNGLPYKRGCLTASSSGDAFSLCCMDLRQAVQSWLWLVSVGRGAHPEPSAACSPQWYHAL